MGGPFFVLGRPWAADFVGEDCANRPRMESTIATQERRGNRTCILDRYTALIGPGYCETRESMVSSVTPSTVAWATKILSKGSL